MAVLQGLKILLASYSALIGESGGLLLVKQVVELVVCGSLHAAGVLELHGLRSSQLRLVASQVRRRVLEAVVV